jgi:cytochrome P450
VATAPGITQWIPLPYGLFKEFLCDPLSYQLRARERFGDVFRSRIGPSLVHFLYHPDHVRRVLYEHQKNYPRGWHYRLLRSLLGNGLVASEGDHWRRQRRLAQPAFHRQRLSGYAQVMVEATSGMLARWDGSAVAGNGMVVGVEMSRLTLAISGRTLFGRDPSQEADVVGGAFGVLARYLSSGSTTPSPRCRLRSDAGKPMKEAADPERGRLGPHSGATRGPGSWRSCLANAGLDEETGEG